MPTSIKFKNIHNNLKQRRASNGSNILTNPSVFLMYSNLTDVIKVNQYVSFGEGNGTPLQYSCLENPEEPGRL